MDDRIHLRQPAKPQHDARRNGPVDTRAAARARTLGHVHQLEGREVLERTAGTAAGHRPQPPRPARTTRRLRRGAHRRAGGRGARARHPRPRRPRRQADGHQELRHHAGGIDGLLHRHDRRADRGDRRHGQARGRCRDRQRARGIRALRAGQGAHGHRAGAALDGLQLRRLLGRPCVACGSRAGSAGGVPRRVRGRQARQPAPVRRDRPRPGGRCRRADADDGTRARRGGRLRDRRRRVVRRHHDADRPDEAGRGSPRGHGHRRGAAPRGRGTPGADGLCRLDGGDRAGDGALRGVDHPLDRTCAARCRGTPRGRGRPDGGGSDRGAVTQPDGRAGAQASRRPRSKRPARRSRRSRA